jgi:hypothetical protein
VPLEVVTENLHTAHEEWVIATNTILDTYHPTLPTDTWALMRDFVCGTVRFRFTGGRNHRDVERALHALTGFADWVLLTDIADLDASVLSADVIDAYTAHRYAEVEPHIAERERKLLRTLAGLQNGPEDRPSTTTAPPSQPYDRDEQDAIRWWTQWQATDRRRSTCLAIAALGLGCGLTAQEMVHTRARHIVTLSDGMMGVRTEGREVPVTAEWNGELAALKALPANSHVIAPNAGARNPQMLQDVLRSSGQPRPVPQRMRATWLLNHVDGGTPLNTLIDAAGLTSPDVLRRLLPFAIRLEGQERVSALRLSNGGAR